MRFALPTIVLCVGVMLAMTSRMQAQRDIQLGAGLSAPEPLLLSAIAAGRDGDEPTSEPASAPSIAAAQ